MYAKVFDVIFDSSIADNYELRHFFMDLLVLADCNGIVDKTASAIAARTRIPIEKVTSMLEKLEQPDGQSRNPEHNGKRIERLDTHRSWGWYIVNYGYYRNLAKESDRRAAAKESMERHRTKVKNAQVSDKQAGNALKESVNSPSLYPSVVASVVQGGEGGKIDHRSKFEKPSLETVKFHGLKIGLPEPECEKFFDYYEANGWKVGKNPMRLWTAAMANWKRHWIEYGGLNTAGNGQPQKTTKTPTVFELKEIIRAKETQAVDLKLKHCSEMAMGEEWSDSNARKQFFDLKREIKSLNQRIANAYS